MKYVALAALPIFGATVEFSFLLFFFSAVYSYTLLRLNKIRFVRRLLYFFSLKSINLLQLRALFEEKDILFSCYKGYFL